MCVSVCCLNARVLCFLKAKVNALRQRTGGPLIRPSPGAAASMLAGRVFGVRVPWVVFHLEKQPDVLPLAVRPNVYKLQFQLGLEMRRELVQLRLQSQLEPIVIKR